MTLPELMSALRAHGATLALHGDRVKVRAPAPLPDTLMDAVRAQKADIVAALRDQGAKAPRTAAELVATLPQAPCPGGCGRQTAYGWECLSCRCTQQRHRRAAAGDSHKGYGDGGAPDHDPVGDDDTVGDGNSAGHGDLARDGDANTAERFL